MRITRSHLTEVQRISHPEMIKREMNAYASERLKLTQRGAELRWRTGDTTCAAAVTQINQRALLATRVLGVILITHEAPCAKP